MPATNPMADAQCCPDGANHNALTQEDPPNGSRGHAHRFQDPDFTRLVGHDHRQRADNVERGDEDDEQDDETHDELLQLECPEE